MIGRQGAGRQHRPLDTLLSARRDEILQVLESAEFRLVDRRFGTDGERRANLGDNDANLPRWYLDPGVLGDAVYRPQFHAQPGHEQFPLVTGLSLEGNRLIRGEFLAHPLDDEAYFGRPDVPGGRQHEDEYNRQENEDAKNNTDDDHGYPLSGFSRADYLITP